jgi:hypothetical protein
MDLTTETFLARSREYLLGAGVQWQQSVRPDLAARADRPCPGPRRRARKAKGRRTGVG